MPIRYECDHQRRLITATFTEPHTIDTKHIGTLEVLLTKAQLEEWLARNAQRQSTL